MRTVLASLVLASSVLGCQTSSEPITISSAPLAQSEQDAAIQSLAFDPAFVDYAELAIAVARRTRQVAGTAPDRDAAATEARDIVDDAAAGATPAQTVTRATTLTGVTQAELAELRRRTQALLVRFPNLHKQGPSLIGHAIHANPELRQLQDDSSSTSGATRPPDDELTDCLRDCDDEYRKKHNTSVAIFAIETAVCTGLVVFPPASLGCFAGAMADSMRRELEAADAFDDCKDRCFGLDPDGECEADADCAPDEWCDKGTAGIGDNVCKPDKSIGQVCSRDGKCLSGCCKYDFFQHPLSMTCNPANDCN